MAGRPVGTTKNPNRRRVRNPNGRLIDFEGIQYNKYVYNEQDNSFVKPSKITKDAFDGEAQSHELAIIDKNNLEVQMEKMKKRVTVLLERYLKEFNGCKSHFGFSIELYKPSDGDTNEKITINQSAKVSIITNKSEIRKALRDQKEDNI